ncbi:MAG: hypothetical protein ACO1RA_07890 [Planctomycetaceae bacterium]
MGLDSTKEITVFPSCDNHPLTQVTQVPVQTFGQGKIAVSVTNSLAQLSNKDGSLGNQMLAYVAESTKSPDTKSHDPFIFSIKVALDSPATRIPVEGKVSIKVIFTTKEVD